MPACVAVFCSSAVYRNLRAFQFLASSGSSSRAVRGNFRVVASCSRSPRTPSPSRHCRASKAALSCSHSSAWRAAVLTSHSSGRLRRRLTPALGGRAFSFVFAPHRQVRVPHAWWFARRRAVECFFAWSCVARCARFSFSLLRAVHDARFAVMCRSSQAVRAGRARHHLQGIAGR